MSFDALWRLNMRAVEPERLRAATAAVLDELPGVRAEWHTRGAQGLTCVLRLPPALVRQFHEDGSDARLPPPSDEALGYATEWMVSPFDEEEDAAGSLVSRVMPSSEDVSGMAMAFIGRPAWNDEGLAVGDEAFRHTGGWWQPDETAPEAGLCALDVHGGELWAAGSQGALYRTGPAGSRWTKVETGTDDCIQTVCVRSP